MGILNGVVAATVGTDEKVERVLTDLSRIAKAFERIAKASEETVEMLRKDRASERSAT